MSHQSVVTNYFTRKRQRVFKQPSKRLKVLDLDAITAEDEFSSTENSSENRKQGIQSTRVKTARMTRLAAKKLNSESDSAAKKVESQSFSATLGNKASVPIENSVVTAACDNHDASSPKKRNLSNALKFQAKRGSISSPQDFCDSTQLSTRKVDFVKSSAVKQIQHAKRQLLLPVVWKNADQLISTQKNQETTNKSSDLRKRNENFHMNTPCMSQLDEVKKQARQLSNKKDPLLIMKQLKRSKQNALEAVATDSGFQAKKKEKTEKEFAYRKYHSLAQEVPKDLILPFKYKILQEMFHSVDTIVSMLFNRQQTATWNKVQKSVEEMLRRKFEQNNLRQIKHVFPDAYRFRQEKGIPTFSNSVEKVTFQLTLEPILDKNESTTAKRLTGSMLVQRRHHFHIQILDIVKQHHQNFLAKLNPPVHVDSKHLRRWHPEFLLDHIPDVLMSELPSPPEITEQKCHSAKDVLIVARNQLTKQATEALRKVAERCSSPNTPVIVAEENNICTTSAVDIRGISTSLLAKIRAKEAERKLKKMIRSDEQVNKINHLRLLPSIARSLKTLYVSERRSSLPLDFICSKLLASCPSVPTQASMRQHLRLLSNSTTPWFVTVTNRNKEYGKLDKDKGICAIIAKLEELVAQAEKE